MGVASESSPPVDENAQAARITARLSLVATLGGSDLGSTVVQDRPSGEQPFVDEALALLRTLERGPGGPAFPVGPTLGVGGGGVVRLGRQRSLARQVAIKTLADHFRSRESILGLLREALVIGRLEHPNVLPVYDVELDDEGVPRVALKRIAGVDWSALLPDAAEVERRFGARDLLEWNLRVFMQVCAAVEHAHGRGIMHRDIKPENVLVGEHGEVYLADWGIALPLELDGSARLERASGFAGTPYYMAPEMFDEHGRDLGARTDVYLLGSTLYEIFTGQPPHQRSSLMQVAHSALVGVQLGDGVPREAVAIVRKAMSVQPAARYPSADALRRAVEDFLRHRDASRLVERAEARLAELEARARAGIDPSADRIRDLFGECRFGFQHALEVWPDHPGAQAGYDRALALVAELEMRSGEPLLARARLREMLGAPPAALASRVEAAAHAAEEERARLERLDRELDPMRGRGVRLAVVAILGVMWVLGPTVGHFLLTRHGGWAMPPWFPIGLSSSLLFLVGVLSIWIRRGLRESAITRRLVSAVVFGVAIVCLARIVALQTGTSPLEIMHQQLLVWAGITAMLGVTVDRRIYAATLAMAVAYGMTPVTGLETVLAWLAAANAVVVTTGFALWGRGLPEKADASGD